jgi:hypothetical protein
VSPLAGVPEARSVKVDQFLRPATTTVAVVYGDMNGVPPEEIVLHSRAAASGDVFRPQEYVDAYSWHPGDKTWVKVFDATTFEDPNVEGPVLESGPGFSQALEGPFAMVDFVGDGTPELVLAVFSSGASAGPLRLWIFSWLSEAFTTEFTFATERGGALTLNPDKTITLEAGEYGPNDPGCCPSNQSVRVIGYDQAEKKVKVLKTQITPT